MKTAKNTTYHNKFSNKREKKICPDHPFLCKIKYIK